MYAENTLKGFTLVYPDAVHQIYFSYHPKNGIELRLNLTQNKGIVWRNSAKFGFTVTLHQMSDDNGKKLGKKSVLSGL